MRMARLLRHQLNKMTLTGEQMIKVRSFKLRVNKRIKMICRLGGSMMGICKFRVNKRI
jgi:hypothetical protein